MGNRLETARQSAVDNKPNGAAHGKPLLACAVYDGRTRLGSVRESVSGGFDAFALDGAALGHFRKMKQAADAVSRVAGGAA